MVVTIDVRHLYKFPIDLVVKTHFTKVRNNFKSNLIYEKLHANNAKDHKDKVGMVQKYTLLAHLLPSIHFKVILTI